MNRKQYIIWEAWAIERAEVLKEDSIGCTNCGHDFGLHHEDTDKCMICDCPEGYDFQFIGDNYN